MTIKARCVCWWVNSAHCSLFVKIHAIQFNFLLSIWIPNQCLMMMIYMYTKWGQKRKHKESDDLAKELLGAWIQTVFLLCHTINCYNMNAASILISHQLMGQYFFHSCYVIHELYRSKFIFLSWIWLKFNNFVCNHQAMIFDTHTHHQGAFWTLFNNQSIDKDAKTRLKLLNNSQTWTCSFSYMIHRDRSLLS